MLSVVADEAAQAALRMDLDGLAREGARRMLAVALEAEVEECLAAYAAERDECGGGWSCATATRQREVLTAAGVISVRALRVDDRRVDPVTGERARSARCCCRRGAVRAPRSLRCCRCCTCTGCPPATSSRRWRRSSVLGPGCPRRSSPAWSPPGRPTTRSSRAATCPTATMCTSGRTGSTSGCGWSRLACVAWCWWGARRRHQGAGRRGRR
jgi:hypothetical protein